MDCFHCVYVWPGQSNVPPNLGIASQSIMSFVVCCGGRGVNDNDISKRERRHLQRKCGLTRDTLSFLFFFFCEKSYRHSGNNYDGKAMEHIKRLLVV